MFVLYPGLARVDISLELLGVVGGIIINISLGLEVEFLMMGRPLSFLQEGVHQLKKIVKML